MEKSEELKIKLLDHKTRSDLTSFTHTPEAERRIEEIKKTTERKRKSFFTLLNQGKE